MSVTTERRIVDFVEAGVAAHEAGVLHDALAELCIRLDLTAGDLIHELINNRGVPARARWRLPRRVRRGRR